MNHKEDSSSVVLAGNTLLDSVSDGVSFHDFRGHTFLFGLKEFLPEDILWRKEHPRVPSLACFEDDRGCDCPWGCVPKMAMRCMWFFSRFEKLQQILVLFKREDKVLYRQKFVRLTVDGDLIKNSPDIPVEAVPRVWVLLVPNNFYSLSIPYRLFRANYNGLQLVLQRSQRTFINVGCEFWSGIA